MGGADREAAGLGDPRVADRGDPARGRAAARCRHRHRHGSASTAAAASSSAGRAGLTGAAGTARAVTSGSSSRASAGCTFQSDGHGAVLGQHRVLGRGRRPGRPDHRVARGVPGVDELDDVDPVADHPQHQGAQRVGEHVGEALAQDRVPGQRPVRAGRTRGRRRAGAARRGGSTARPGRPGDSQRAARARASSVAVSQACRASTSTGGCPSNGSASPMAPTWKVSPSSPASAASRVLRSTTSGRMSMPTVCTSPQPLGQEPVRGEGEVGVAAAEVDDADRAVGGQPVQGGLEQAQERVHLAALVAVRAEHAEQRVVRRRAAAGGPGRASAPRRPGGWPAARCTCAAPFLVTRSCTVSSTVSTCQLPNGSASSASTVAAAAPYGVLRVVAVRPSWVTTWSTRPLLRSTGRSSARATDGCAVRRRPGRDGADQPVAGRAGRAAAGPGRRRGRARRPSSPIAAAAPCIPRLLCKEVLAKKSLQSTFGIMNETPTAPRQPDPQELRLDARTLRGLAHPLRVRILGMLRRDGAATATGLAEKLRPVQRRDQLPPAPARRVRLHRRGRGARPGPGALLEVRQPVDHAGRRRLRQRPRAGREHRDLPARRHPDVRRPGAEPPGREGRAAGPLAVRRHVQRHPAAPDPRPGRRAGRAHVGAGRRVPARRRARAARGRRHRPGRGAARRSTSSSTSSRSPGTRDDRHDPAPAPPAPPPAARCAR